MTTGVPKTRDDALPSADDGLTLAQREGLVAVGPSRRWRKTADILSLEQPGHSQWEAYYDAEYLALIDLAIPERSSQPLLAADGNIGSIDGDEPAGPKFVRFRRSAVGAALVGAAPDASSAEPNPADPLPGAFPNLLVNGSQSGLARMLPHNLREVAAAITARIDDPSSELDDLMEHLPGPDFPSGGLILDGGEIRQAYGFGRGALRVRGVLRMEPDEQPARIVITQLPFLVEKGGDHGLIVEIVNEWHLKNLADVGDVQDESDRSGMSLVINLKPGREPERTRALLYARTSLEIELEVRSLALVDDAPRTLPLLALIDRYIVHQRAVLRRSGPRTDHDVDDEIKTTLARLADEHGRDRRTRIIATL